MRAFRGLSKILLVFPVIVFVWDVCDSWFVHNNLRLRTLHEWGIWLSAESYEKTTLILANIFPDSAIDAYVEMPAALALLIPPAFFYIIYRIWFTIRGGHGARGGFTYKSHD